MKGPFAKLNPFSKDRNDQARVQAAQQQFAAQVALGHVSPRDRLGREVSEGDYLIWDSPHTTIWEVAKVTPILDGSAPPGFVRVELHAATYVQTMANNVNPTLIKIGSKTPEPVSGPVDPREPDPRD